MAFLALTRRAKYSEVLLGRCPQSNESVFRDEGYIR